MSGLVAASRRNRVISTCLGCALVAVTPLLSGLAQAQVTVPQDAKPLCAVSPQTFASWFGGTVTLNGAVNPANSVTFPNTGDCSFYQWSEQMFLWLTSPAPSTYGGGKSLVFNSPIFYNVSGANNQGKRTYTQNQPDLPLPLLNIRSAQAGPNGLQLLTSKDGRMFEVLPAPQTEKGQSLIRNSAGKLVEINRVEAQDGKKPTFFDANDKKITLPGKVTMDTTLAARVAPRLLTADSTATKNMVQGFQVNGKTVFIDSLGNTIEPTQGQAGSLSGVLVGQNQSLVYYATMVNDVFAYFQTGVANGVIPNPTNVFPTTQAQLDPVIAYAASKGTKFPAPEALAMEVKTSWIDVVGLDALGLKASNYVTVTSTVPLYNKSNTQLWIPTGQTKSVVLALVGMHVVGSAKGHPEMIWATFEHVSNTPNAAYSYTNTSGTTVNVAQNTTGTWLFSSLKSATPNVQLANFTSSPNITANTSAPIGPSDTLRWKAWGTGSDATNVLLENTEVISSNSSVLSQLIKGDLRTNYMMTGATWTIGGQTVTPTNQVGTNLLNNTTLETYDQGTSSKINGSNCFSCHSNKSQPAGQPANTVVSHIYNTLIPLYPK
ncbi:hypothetical protein H8L32_06820 [Undibacterium sp. CY18W]|uniref:Cytochrome c family protein n=1 Tax=Undibacterium hunanense TaxID=2762292 RepID=A0ABR6ZMR6_9BURK|nr:hypothetical protein [Undibacterium hunanense]MBC3917182.1 hypothetical protein [Undibacterium hunanense]